jgi:hypothetical protein
MEFLAMKKALLAGIAALFLATGAAHADCCDMAPITPATREFYVAAIRQFGRGFSSVGLFGEQWKDCSVETIGCVLRLCDKNWPSSEGREKQECSLKGSAVIQVSDTRYLGLEEGKIYLMCSYRTKPMIRFYNCWAWEGD